MFKRTLLTSIGATLFISGVVFFPLPVPLGLPLMIIGLSLMLKASNRIKRLILRLVNKNTRSRWLWHKTRRLHKRQHRT